MKRAFNNFSFFTRIPCVILAFLFVVAPAARAQGAQAIRTIDIGMLSTTHILFTSDLTYVDISSPQFIAAKVVDASKNMLAIKAKQEFAFTTTISALEANGTMHTFYVRFDASPAVLVIDTRVPDGQASAGLVNTQIRPDNAYVAPSYVPQPQQSVSQDGGRPGRDKKQKASKQKTQKSSVSHSNTYVGNRQNSSGAVTVTSSQTSNFGRANAPTIEEVMKKRREIYHATDKTYNLVASIVNVFAYSDLTYIVIGLENNSDIGYEAGDAQFTVENRRISAKTLSTDKSVWPKSSYGTLSCPPGAKTMIGYTIPKMTLQKNEVLKIYIYEKAGTRNLFLSLDDKDINYAVSPL